MRIGLVFLTLAVLAVVPYVPVFTQPLIADDYQQIDMGRSWGPVSGWPQLAAEPLFRTRATSILFTHWTEVIFGMSPRVFYASAVLLHVLNVWLLFALGFWNRIGWRVSFAMAAFFAIYLGHQEAVMWYAAVHELLMLLFALCFLLAWIRWVQSGNWLYYALSVMSFVLALYSKEPAVVLVPLAVLIAWWEKGQPNGAGHWRRVLGVAPLAVVTCFYTAAIFSAATTHQHFNDGTFSLHAPFWLTWRNSFGRLLWVWGLVSLVWLWGTGEWKRLRGLLLAAAVWISLTLLPFSFLTYMQRIPSRHTYFPSVGLALLVGVGLVSFHARMQARHKFATATVAAVMCMHQCLYLWFVKRPQYLARAQPTETILRLVRQGRTPIRIHCFPYYHDIPELAVSMMLHTDPKTALIWDEGYPNTNCPAGTFSGPATQQVPAGLH